jgi:hypothetical protein
MYKLCCNVAKRRQLKNAWSSLIYYDPFMGLKIKSKATPPVVDFLVILEGKHGFNNNIGDDAFRSNC